jgi:hypothetical protein
MDKCLFDGLQVRLAIDRAIGTFLRLQRGLADTAGHKPGTPATDEPLFGVCQPLNMN